MKPRKTPALTHLDARGHAHMVDVGDKAVTRRTAVARARITMAAATAKRLRSGDTPKGDVLATARIAGIQAAKRTPEWIPLCHTIALTKVTIELEVRSRWVDVTATAVAVDKTGVEMEALVAASAAALTVYDMLKAVDRGMTIALGLHEKHGGRSGSWVRAEQPREQGSFRVGSKRPRRTR